MPLRKTSAINSGAELQELFKKHGREKQFTNEGFDKIYEDLVAIGYDEVDVVEICCMYGEYEYSEFIEYYFDDDDLTDYIMESYDIDEIMEGFSFKYVDEEELAESVDSQSFSDKLDFIESYGNMDELVSYLIDRFGSRTGSVIGVTDAETVIVSH